MRWRIGRELERAVAAKRRVQIALIVLILLLGALLATGTYSAFALYQSAEDRYIHLLFPLRTRSQDLVLQMVNEETGVRGYMITSDRKTLYPYFAGRANVRADLARIEQLTATRPDLHDELAPLRADIQDLHGYFDRQVTFVADGILGQRRARADVLGGQKIFNRFRGDAKKLETSITAFVDQTRSDQRRTFLRAVGLLAASGLFALAIAVFLMRRVPERLRQLYSDEEQARIRAEQGANAARALAHVSDAVVMVHDYHLYTLPALVRSARPDVFLHHFVHIPWTQPDAWRVLPSMIREEIYDGVLANDIVGFHTRAYRRNFLQCCKDLMGYDVDFKTGVVRCRDREVWVRAYPLPIDWRASLLIGASARELEIFEASRDMFLPGGRAPLPSEYGGPAFLPLTALNGDKG